MSPGLDSFQLKTCSITSYRSSNENNRWHNLGTFCLNFQLSSQTRADKSRRLLHRRMARRRPVWNETLCRWRLPCSRDDVDDDNDDVTDEEAEQASVCRWESSRSEACSCFWLFCKTSASFKFRWWLLLFVSLSDNIFDNLQKEKEKIARTWKVFSSKLLRLQEIREITPGSIFGPFDFFVSCLLHLVPSSFFLSSSSTLSSSLLSTVRQKNSVAVHSLCVNLCKGH